MTNPKSVVKPEVLIENKMTIHGYLQQSYKEAKKQLDNGITCIQDGISFIKDEFSGFHQRAAEQISRIEWPVNNFLKDTFQLESELRKEINPQDDYPLTGTIIPMEIALQSPMEENY